MRSTQAFTTVVAADASVADAPPDVARNRDDSAHPPAAPVDASHRWLDLLATLVPVASYLLAAVSLAPRYLYEIDPDSISYLSIAQKYARLHLRDAVNAYWSPLYSWLMAAWVACGVDALVAAKIVGIVAGAGTIVTAGVVARRCGLRPATRLLVGLLPVPVVVYLTLFRDTPDVLVGMLLTIFLAQQLRPSQRTSPGGVITGAIIAIGYYGKAYALPFGVTCLALLGLHAIFTAPDRALRRRAVGRLAVAFVVMAVLVAPWVAALKWKYHRLMLGSVSTQAFRLAGPQTRMSWPLHTRGFASPPNKTAISAWEDPTHMRLPEWSPLHSRREARYALGLLQRNVVRMGEYLHQYTLLAGVILGGVVILLILRRGRFALDLSRRAALARMTLMLLIFCGGYLPLYGQMRYLVFAGVIHAVMAGVVLEAAGWAKWNHWLTVGAATLLLASFYFWPAREFADDFSHPLVGANCYIHATRIRPILPPRTVVCADDDTSYHRALTIAYHLNLRFMGMPRADATPDEQLAAMHKAGVRYVLSFDAAAPRHLPFLANQPNLAADVTRVLRIYAVPPAPSTRPAATATSSP